MIYIWKIQEKVSKYNETAIWKGKIIMVNKIHLIDGMGTWVELPLTENNMQHTPNAVEINDNVVKMYIS